MHMVVLQATLVSTHLFGDTLSGCIKGSIGLESHGTSIDTYAATDVDGNFSPAQMCLL